MQVAKFIVPESVLTKFLEYTTVQGLKTIVVSKKEDEYTIEIPHTKEQAPIIDEMTELVEVLTVIVLASLAALSYLVEAAQKNPVKKPAPLKTLNKKYCFKAFLLKSVKHK